MIKRAIPFILLTVSSASGAHFFDGKDQRIDFTDEGYPYRAIGKLVHKISNGNLFACTAFLTGPSEITTARHCLVDKATGRYVKEVFFVLPDSSFTGRRNGKYYKFRAQVPQNGKRWKFEEEGAVSLNLDLDSSNGTNLGDLMGYFGVSGLHVRRDGYVGTLPNSYSSRLKKNFCRQGTSASRPLEWFNQINTTQPNKGEEWTATPEQQKTIVRMCSAGFPSDVSISQRKLMVENKCGLGGALFDGVRTTCWTCGGSSGGPLFYYEDGQYYAIAVHSLSYPTVRNANGIEKSSDGKFLIGEPFGSDFFNFAALIIPDVYRRVHKLSQKGFYSISNGALRRARTRHSTLGVAASHRPKNK
ncbi:MAG: hypothetical protein QNI91_08155 [Arenicellales bacterium]|nr:hypothetical protein [Arenicellales bacterium]